MRNWKHAALCAAVLAAVVFIAVWIEPDVENVGYKSPEYALAESDSLLVSGCWEGRQAGEVNLEKFLELAGRTVYFDSYKRAGRDSITFVANSPRIFFGNDSNLLGYQNLGISIGEDRKSFTAAVTEKDGVKYIYIPYHILVSLAAAAGQ